MLVLNCFLFYYTYRQLQEASRPVSGDFSITIGETSLQFPHNVTAEQLANLLSAQLPQEGGMYVQSIATYMYIVQ